MLRNQVLIRCQLLTSDWHHHSPDLRLRNSEFGSAWFHSHSGWTGVYVARRSCNAARRTRARESASSMADVRVELSSASGRFPARRKRIGITHITPLPDDRDVGTLILGAFWPPTVSSLDSFKSGDWQMMFGMTECGPTAIVGACRVVPVSQGHGFTSTHPSKHS